jgi:dynein heavy chain 1
MLVVQAFRPDCLLAAGRLFVAACLGPAFMGQAEQELNMGEVVDQEIKASTPILMCSVPGFDVSGRVEDLAAEMSKQMSSIAIGMPVLNINPFR